MGGLFQTQPHILQRVHIVLDPTSCIQVLEIIATDEIGYKAPHAAAVVPMCICIGAAVVASWCVQGLADRHTETINMVE